ncbi:hypothetical protein D3C72_1800900 [compost metagenome]
MPEHGDELFADFRDLNLFLEPLFRGDEPIACIQMICNQFCKQLEHRQDLGIVHLRRAWIDRAQRPEECAVTQGNRN